MGKKVIGKNGKNIYIYILLIVLAFGFIFLNSPLLFKGFGDTDANVFCSIGMYMRMGLYPYKDIFDHKGPLLYVINYIANTPIKMIFIEGISLSISMIAFFKMARIESKWFVSLVISIISLSFLGRYICGGNYSEEFALPFISIALYIFLKYLREENVNSLLYFLSGVCLACVILLRPNMIAVWIVCCIYILCNKIYKKEIKELLRIIFIMVIGVLLVIVPFIIWMCRMGMVDAFVDDFLLFNFIYCSVEFQAKKLAFMGFVVTKMILLLIVITYTLFLKKDYKEFGIYLILIILSLALISMSGSGSWHYVIPMVALLPFIFSQMYELVKCSKVLRISFVIILLLFFCINYLEIIGKFNSNLTYSGREVEKICEYIKGYTNEEDTISVYGNNCEFYILTKRYPASKYIYQFPICEFDVQIKKEFFSDLKKNLPKVIVVSTDYFDENIAVFLREKEYEVIDELDGVFKVYRK